ncbi:MAG: hypothetical protein AAB306_00820 [Pseudomonadota bacterium]|jgi:hypothetical protein
MLWTIVNVLTLFVLAIFAYLLWRKTQNKVGSFGIGDLTNIATLVVAVFSLYVAVAAYQKSVKDSEEQQKSLDASREQLQAVVDAATKQQEILSRNLETSKAQQELLSKNLEISKSQLSLVKEQRKEEQERQARKPIAEITLQTPAGPKPLDDLEKLPEIDFPLEKGRKWEKVVFRVLNKGKAEIIRPVVKIFSSQDKVSVDEGGYGHFRAEGRLRDATLRNEIQFSGLSVNDIEPAEIAGGGSLFTVDITVPDSINAFDLTFLIHGKNLSRKAHTLHFKVIRPSS